MRLVTFDLFPKAWEDLFLARGPDVFNTLMLVNIFQHMESAVAISAVNCEKQNKENRDKKGKEEETMAMAVTITTEVVSTKTEEIDLMEESTMVAEATTVTTVDIMEEDVLQH